MQYNWDWGVIFREPYLEWMLSGIGWTMSVSIAAWILAFSLGSIIGILRTTNNRILRAIATVYVEIFRNIPLIVQMFLWYFVFPELLPNDSGMWVKREMPMPEFTTAAICLGLYTASRVAEQIRSGIQSIGQGQNNAGLATGLTTVQVYRYILLPVGYRIMIPPLTSEFLTIFKNSSVALTIGVLEITAQARQIEEYTFQGFEAFTTATILYIIVTSIVMILMRVVEGRVSIPGMISLGAK